jgi:hypothetical protein
MITNNVPSIGAGEGMAVNSDYNKYSEEWKVCRDTADRFDEILHDLLVLAKEVVFC